MTNAERIQAHNELLAECIETAENLPDAGSGVVETCTVTFDLSTIDLGKYNTVYLDANLLVPGNASVDTTEIFMPYDLLETRTLVVPKNAIVAVGGNGDYFPTDGSGGVDEFYSTSESGGAIFICNRSAYYLGRDSVGDNCDWFLITGDATIVMGVE